jgi:hypothetical protein
MQFIGLFSAAVVIIAVIAGVYLNVTARAATIGREIQDLQSEILILERDIEDLETELADQNSADTMLKRAKDLGYEEIEPGRAAYIQVENYPGKQIAQLAPEAQQPAGTQAELPREFTISLIEWIKETLYLIGLQTGAQAEGE